jgi:hypothetical protein
LARTSKEKNDVCSHSSGQGKGWHGGRAGTSDQGGGHPIISDVPGFQAYYVIYAPDDTVTAISIFDDYSGAQESNRRGLAWSEQSLAPLQTGASHSGRWTGD